MKNRHNEPSLATLANELGLKGAGTREDPYTREDPLNADELELLEEESSTLRESVYFLMDAGERRLSGGRLRRILNR